LAFTQSLDSTLCNYTDFSDSSTRNLGLIGGVFKDLQYSRSGDRLFLATESPQSLFYSNDTGSSWVQAFSNDSLVFECGNRGWGGGAHKIQVNNFGGVAVLTKNDYTKISSCVLSQKDGDTLTWRTVLDNYIMAQNGDTIDEIYDFSLTDSYLMISAGRYIVKYDLINLTYTTLDISILITDIDADSLEIVNVAAANVLTSYPLYFAAHDNGISDEYRIYSYNGISITLLSWPADIKNVSEFSLLIHPMDKSADTLFISGLDSSNTGINFFRSYDKGVSWTNINYSSSSYAVLKDVDYLSNWQSSYPQSGGGILFAEGMAYSADLGTSWNDFYFIDGTYASINPQNKDQVCVTRERLGVYCSDTGFTAEYVRKNNENLYAQKVNKVAVSQNKNHVYVATAGGLAYTSAYNNNKVEGIFKWHIPYGVNSITSFGVTGEAYTVVMSPYDTNHVVAGVGSCFVYTKTGFSGFTKSNCGTVMESKKITDIKFVSENVLIGVTAGLFYVNEDNYGEIWRSTDGGENWVDVTPSGFNNGNCVAVGMVNSDTVIYVGTGMTEIDSDYDTSSAKGYLWKSSDLGLSWQIVNTGPDGINDTSVTGLPIHDIIVDPRSNDTIYLAAGYYNEYAFVRSTDGGQTYTYPTKDIKRLASSTAVEFLSTSYDTILFTIQSDIYLYSAVKDSSRLIYRGFATEVIPDIQAGSILAGTTTGFYLIGIEDINVLVTGENNLDQKQSIFIYPNPTEHNIQIQTTFNLKGTKIELYHVNGQKIYDVSVLNRNTYSLNINLSDLNFTEGIYLLQFTLKDGNSYNQKIVFKN
jgi:hypothetical protein